METVLNLYGCLCRSCWKCCIVLMKLTLVISETVYRNVYRCCIKKVIFLCWLTFLTQPSRRLVTNSRNKIMPRQRVAQIFGVFFKYFYRALTIKINFQILWSSNHITYIWYIFLYMNIKSSIHLFLWEKIVISNLGFSGDCEEAFLTVNCHKLPKLK